MRRFWSLFVKGFLTILPLAVTLYIVFWIIGSAEALVGGLFLLILPNARYIPGMGLLGGVVILIGLGLLMEKKGGMSYQIGGFMVYIPRSRIEPLDMGFEEATKLVLTAGVGNRENA